MRRQGQNGLVKKMRNPRWINFTYHDCRHFETKAPRPSVSSKLFRYAPFSGHGTGPVGRTWFLQGKALSRATKKTLPTAQTCHPNLKRHLPYNQFKNYYWNINTCQLLQYICRILWFTLPQIHIFTIQILSIYVKDLLGIWSIWIKHWFKIGIRTFLLKMKYIF
jgi:hypothetical protein